MNSRRICKKILVWHIRMSTGSLVGLSTNSSYQANTFNIYSSIIRQSFENERKVTKNLSFILQTLLVQLYCWRHSKEIEIIHWFALGISSKVILPAHNRFQVFNSQFLIHIIPSISYIVWIVNFLQRIILYTEASLIVSIFNSNSRTTEC